jgi:FKBP-type peptidyl-prolyl cis-trans isomerase FkpA
MKRIFYLFALILLISGCQDTRFKKTKTGMEYKVIKGSGGTPIKYGNMIKYKMRVYYVGNNKDSLLTPEFDTLAKIAPIDSTSMPSYFTTIFLSAQKGDSIITRMPTDSIRKHNPQLPAFAKSGSYISNRIKIIDVYTDSASAAAERSRMETEMMRADSVLKATQLVKDDKILTDYMAQNNVKNAVKTGHGVYVVIENPGTGDAIDSGKAVTINYKGRNLKGEVFDESYDSTGKPVKPYTFVVGQHRSIEGFDEGVRLFKKGGKGKLFIPSTLAYGPRPMGPKVDANENLMFDIEIADVVSGEEYQKKMQEKNQGMNDLRKKIMEARKDTSKKIHK